MDEPVLDKPTTSYHEEWVADEDIADVKKIETTLSKINVSGTVKLKLTAGRIVYIPEPTPDPRDPLNLPPWRKTIAVIIISIFSTIGLAIVSGFGGLLGFYIPEYVAKGATEANITHLMTYPTLTMGIGNLIGMPLAIAVGRRSVLIGACLIMVLSCGLCAYAKDIQTHLGLRMLLGLAAGQSESLVPMITQELFFLHERARYLMVQLSLQAILSAIMTVFASPIAGAITPQGWYGLGAGLSGLILVLAILFHPETKYYRPRSAYQEADSKNDPDSKEPTIHLVVEKPPLDFVNYKARTWSYDLKLWNTKPEWNLAVKTFVQAFQLLLFPNVFWALCLNGLAIGVNIAIGTTYGQIVTAAPYNWPQSSASYVNCGQIITSIVALPFFGHGSDMLIKWFATRRNGIHEPEIRLIPLFLPTIVGIFTPVLYGQGAAHPQNYHWFTYVWAVAAYYFTFVGFNIVAITYLLDSYPQRASSLLVIICAFRGIISFGVSYGIAPFVQSHGYDGAFGTFGGLTGALGLLGIPMYIWGKRIREITGKYAVDKEKDE